MRGSVGSGRTARKNVHDARDAVSSVAHVDTGGEQ
jgi:hypothetical protein